MAIIMKGYVCVLLLGLVSVIRGSQLDSKGSETESKDVVFKDNFASPLNLEKIKRGAVKISNVDNPGFNHLTTSSSSGGSSAGSSSSSGSSNAVGFKPTFSSGIPPFRYIHSSQFQPFYTPAYLQPSHSAAQIAAQYSFQGTPLAHYLQTPTQVQYVSAPVAQLPLVKFQSFGGDYSSAGSIPDASASSSSTTTTSSSSSSPSSSSSASSTSSASSSSSQTHHAFIASSQASASPALQSNTQQKEYYLYQTAKPIYYAQQPFVTFFVQPQTAAPANFLYQHPGVSYFYKQQPHPYLGFQGTNRFGVYSTNHANQLTYLVPMTVAAPPAHHDGFTGNELKASQNKLQATSGGSFSYANKG